jgi:DNA-directed RNA polymerase alpha subunit
MFNADQLRQFADILETAARGFREISGAVPAVSGEPESPQTPLRECYLSVRSQKACRKLGVETVEQLAAKTERDIIDLKNCGVAVLNELRAALRVRGKAFTESMI